MLAQLSKSHTERLHSNVKNNKTTSYSVWATWLLTADDDAGGFPTLREQKLIKRFYSCIWIVFMYFYTKHNSSQNIWCLSVFLVLQNTTISISVHGKKWFEVSIVALAYTSSDILGLFKTYNENPKQRICRYQVDFMT